MNIVDSSEDLKVGVVQSMAANYPILTVLPDIISNVLRKEFGVDDEYLKARSEGATVVLSIIAEYALVESLENQFPGMPKQ